MDINWVALLDSIQDLRGQLEVWGVTYEGLIVIGLIALGVLLLSFREVIVWYLRISKLQSQVNAMNEQLAEMRKLLETSRRDGVRIREAGDDDEDDESEPAVTPNRRFHLDH